MQQDITKMCADALRAFANKKYKINLKAAHAHELVSAFFGYPSKNAMLADIRYPVSNLIHAKIVVMVSETDIDRRRQELQGLSPDLPNSYVLGEAIYESLFSNSVWGSKCPPFKNFEKAAIHLAEKDLNFQETFKFYVGVPIQHFVSIFLSMDGATLSIIHATETASGDLLGNGKTIIKLDRVAGNIGFGEPQIVVEKWTGGARRKLVHSEGGYSLG